jgi:transcriptional regulator GlxA family with amidase domain
LLATTHWHHCADFAQDSDVALDSGRIYVSRLHLHLSGVTAGMDLALALVEEDFGRGDGPGHRARAGALPGAPVNEHS